jgi:hypothetical protein
MIVAASALRRQSSFRQGHPAEMTVEYPAQFG